MLSIGFVEEWGHTCKLEKRESLRTIKDLWANSTGFVFRLFNFSSSLSFFFIGIRFKKMLLFCNVKFLYLATTYK